MGKAWSVVALLLALVSLSPPARARQLDPGSRQLLSSAKCPAGCSPEEGCVQDATGGGLRCGSCVGNLLLLRDSGMCGECCFSPLPLLLLPLNGCHPTVFR
jgi:hypothetical protein